MRRLVILALVLYGTVLRAADDLFTLQLAVQAGSDQRSAQGTTRPLLRVKSGTRLRVRWSAINQEKSGAIRDITIHFVVDKESAIGQRGLEKPGPDVVYESALVMDFGAQATSAAEFVFEAPPPGIYLVRLETIGAVATHGHEHAASMDLQVVP